MEQAEPQPAFWGKGLLVCWRALGGRWNNEVERADQGAALQKHLSSLGEGVPSWESPELYVHLLQFGVSGGIGKKTSTVRVSSLLADSDLPPNSDQPGFVLRFLPCGDTGFMIQHRA